MVNADMIRKGLASRSAISGEEGSEIGRGQHWDYLGRINSNSNRTRVGRFGNPPEWWDPDLPLMPLPDPDQTVAAIITQAQGPATFELQYALSGLLEVVQLQNVNAPSLADAPTGSPVVNNALDAKIYANALAGQTVLVQYTERENRATVAYMWVVDRRRAGDGQLRHGGARAGKSAPAQRHRERLLHSHRRRRRPRPKNRAWASGRRYRRWSCLSPADPRWAPAQHRWSATRPPTRC